MTAPNLLSEDRPEPKIWISFRGTLRLSLEVILGIVIWIERVFGRNSETNLNLPSIHPLDKDPYRIFSPDVSTHSELNIPKQTDTHNLLPSTY